MAVSETASLYVGDLHPDVTEGHLLQAFSEFHSLVSVRVCKDSDTGKSLCYGYVNFNSHRDANSAIELKNHSLLNGKVIRVMWSHRDPDVRKSGRGNVFVKNLAESVDNAGLHDLFQKYGNILSSKVVMSEDGKSKGYGFVHFETEKSANDAIENLNGSTVAEKQIYVAKFIKKTDRIVAGPDAIYTNLYIKHLDPNITEAVLQEKFSEFGKIISLVTAKDENGLSKGFAFVSYDNPDDARRAVEAMHGSQFGSKNLYVARAQKKAERELILHHQFEEKRKEQALKYKESNIYVKNIDDSVSDEDLRDHFSACGTITSAKVMRDDKGISKGFGFVCFSTPEEANKAVKTFHGCVFLGKPLYVAVAQRKEDRQKQLLLQLAKKVAGKVGHPPHYYAVSEVTPTRVYRSGSGWISSDFSTPTGLFQQSSVNSQHREKRGWMKGKTLLQQFSQSVTSSKKPSTQQLTQSASSESVTQEN